MSAEITEYSDGILSARISGKLTHAELVALQHAASDLIKLEGKVRLLVIVENFQGWDRGGDWGDLSFMRENDQHMEKIAIVGDRKWEDFALIFTGKNYRECPVEYFQPEEIPQAQAWLMESGTGHRLDGCP